MNSELETDWLRRIDIYKTFTLMGFLWGLLCLWLNFAENYCTNELDFRIGTNCKKYSIQSLQTILKCQRLLSTFANVQGRINQ